jgi:hypothetical protein
MERSRGLIFYFFNFFDALERSFFYFLQNATFFQKFFAKKLKLSTRIKLSKIKTKFKKNQTEGLVLGGMGLFLWILEFSFLKEIKNPDRRSGARMGSGGRDPC